MLPQHRAMNYSSSHKVSYNGNNIDSNIASKINNDDSNMANKNNVKYSENHQKNIF